MAATPLLSPTSLVGRRVRVSFAAPVDLGGGVLLARVEGVLMHGVPATFARSTFSLRDVSFAVDPEGHDVTHAGLLCAVVTADLRNLAALEVVSPSRDSASGEAW